MVGILDGPPLVALYVCLWDNVWLEFGNGGLNDVSKAKKYVSDKPPSAALHVRMYSCGEVETSCLQWLAGMFVGQ